MRMTVLLILACGSALVAASGCATGMSPAPASRAPAVASEGDVRVDTAPAGILTFPYARADDVWRVLPGAFQALGIPAGILDPANRLYGNDRVTEQRVADRPLRELFRCGSGGGLTRTQYRIQFGITAQPFSLREGGTEVRLETVAVGRAVSASSSGTTQCVSTGILEMRFQDVIEEALRRSSSGQR